MAYEINIQPKDGWIVIEQTTKNHVITKIYHFFNDDEFLEAAGAESIAKAVDLFTRTAVKKSKNISILNHHEFAKWGIDHWINRPSVLIKAAELGWVEINE